MTFVIGMTGTHTAMVADAHTAHALGNDGVHVLATPMMILFCEIATHNTIAAQLTAGEASVGTHVDIHHLAATPVGGVVTVEATLTAIDDRRFTFAVEGRDDHRQICRGIHERVVVDRERFLARLGK